MTYEELADIVFAWGQKWRINWTTGAARSLITAVASALQAEESPADSPASPVQQLKAEITALATELQDFNDSRISSYGRLTEIVEKLRQLSAV